MGYDKHHHHGHDHHHGHGHGHDHHHHHGHDHHHGHHHHGYRRRPCGPCGPQMGWNPCFNPMKSMCGLLEIWACSVQRYADWSTQMTNCWCPPEPCPPRRRDPCCKPGMLEWICLAEPDEAKPELEMWRNADKPRLKMFVPDGGKDPVAKAEFKRVENVMVLFVTVAQDVAGGTYRGIVVDDHGETCGELSLLVPKQGKLAEVDV